MSAKEKKYERIYGQLQELFSVTPNFSSRMATAVAVLHHKMKDFYWTGFYILESEELLVHNYQGPLACQKLQKDVGVCWAAIRAAETVVVADVHQFEGHIACSSLTNSEIVVPIFSKGKVIGCLDVDSKEFANFDETDAKGLEKIVALIVNEL